MDYFVLTDITNFYQKYTIFIHRKLIAGIFISNILSINESLLIQEVEYSLNIAELNKKELVKYLT